MYIKHSGDNGKLTLSRRRHYHIETSPLICSANQWTGFYMITASVLKGLRIFSFLPQQQHIQSNFMTDSIRTFIYTTQQTQTEQPKQQNKFGFH